MFTEALTYRALGWSVIPIRPSDKKPWLGSWREYQTRQATEDEVTTWFAPDRPGLYMANLGVVAGKVSNLAIVDFDGYTGSDPAAFLRHMGIPANAPIAITGKGFHVYYRHPGGGVRNGVRVGVLSGVGVDLRGDGGYVVAPPSIHENGRHYHWFGTRPEDWVSEWATLPETFTQTVNRDQAQTPLHASDVIQADNEIATLMRGVGSGGRNDACAKLAWFWLKVTNGDEQAALMALRAWNDLNDPPLAERELLATFRSRLSAHRVNEDIPAEAQVMDAKTWAATVRDIPPRRGVANKAIPTLEEVGGIVERDLIILAGRPGMGKSTAAWGTVVDVGIRQSVPTIIFSTEMTANDVARWVASRIFKTPVRDLSPEQWDRALKMIGDAPLTMCDQGALTVEGICDVVKRRPETKLVIVDHIQRIGGGRGENRNLQLGAIAKTLKSLAKDHVCTVLALSQLNRVGEQGDRPRLENLRESGDLEQEADAVVFLWSSHDDPTANPLPVEFYLAKNRHGALAQVECLFHKSLKYFEPMDFQAKLAALAAEMATREKLQELLREAV
jgi:hypothetical protein